MSGPSLQQEWPEHKNTFLVQHWRNAWATVCLPTPNPGIFTRNASGLIMRDYQLLMPRGSRDLRPSPRTNSMKTAKCWQIHAPIPCWNAVLHRKTNFAEHGVRVGPLVEEKARVRSWNIVKRIYESKVLVGQSSWFMGFSEISDFRPSPGRRRPLFSAKSVAGVKM